MHASFSGYMHIIHRYICIKDTETKGDEGDEGSGHTRNDRGLLVTQARLRYAKLMIKLKASVGYINIAQEVIHTMHTVQMK